MKKICICCGLEKDITEFSFRKDTNKYRNQCKDCRKQQKAKYDKEYNTKNKERRKQYRKENEAKIKEHNKQYYEEHKEVLKKNTSEYYHNNKAKAIGLVIPELNGKLIGSAQRVPTPTGSTTILTAVVKKAGVTKEDINAAMKAAANESFGYNEDEIVSSDIVGMRFGSLFDATQTMVNQVSDDQYEVQVVSWYDNENSYTSQMVRTIKYFSELA